MSARTSPRPSPRPCTAGSGPSVAGSSDSASFHVYSLLASVTRGRTAATPASSRARSNGSLPRHEATRTSTASARMRSVCHQLPQSLAQDSTDVGKFAAGQHVWFESQTPPFAPSSRHSAHSPDTPAMRASHESRHDCACALHDASVLEHRLVQIGCGAGFTTTLPVFELLQSITLFGNSGDRQHSWPELHTPPLLCSSRHVPHSGAMSCTRTWHSCSHAVTSLPHAGSLLAHSVLQRASIAPSDIQSSPPPPPWLKSSSWRPQAGHL